MLSSLFSMCRSRFLKSAELVGLESDAIAKLREMGYTERVILTPLCDAWEVLCGRYVKECYDPQSSLFVHPPLTELAQLCSVDEQADAWCSFVYHRLSGHLICDNEFVRNVLRAVNALPCKSSRDAATALRIYFNEMTLPDHDAPWAAEEEVKSWL